MEHLIDCHPPVVSPAVTLLAVVRMMQAGTAPRWNDPVEAAKEKRPQEYVVVLEQDEVKGLFTNRDIVRLVAKQCDFASTPLAEVLTIPVQCHQLAELETDIQVMHCLQGSGEQYLTVVDGLQLVGVLSLEGLRAWQLETLHQLSSSVLAPQSGDSACLSELNDLRAAAIQQHQAHQKLQRFYTALQSAIEGISQVDPQGCFVEVNHAYAHSCGYHPEELVGLPWQTTIFVRDIPILESAYNIMLDTGKISLEARGVTQQGAIFYQQLTMVANRDEQGKFLGHYCFMQDISDRKLAEVKRIESEQRFQAMADCSPALIWVADNQNRRTYFNAEWLKFTGRTLKREIEEGWVTGIHPEDVHDCLSTFAFAFEQRRSLQTEYRYLNHAGDYRWLLDSGRPHFLANGEFLGYVGSCIDITPFKEVAGSLEQANCQLQENINQSIDALVNANAQLQESESRFRSLADSLPALIWVCDAEQLCTYVNQTWQTFTGRSLEQETNWGWLDTIHPDDRSRFLDQIQTCFAEEILLHLEYRRRDRNGTYRWILNTGIPRYIADQFAGMIGCGLDITVSKQNQVALEQAISELKRSNRDLEEFAYVASHDLREPLRKIRSFSELLLEDYAAQIDDKGRCYFNYIIDGAERMDALVQSVLQYSRVGRQDQPPEKVDLNTVVQQIASDYSLLLEQKKGWIIYDLLPTVIIGKVEITQLLQNLIGNALKFHGEQPPHITVKAQRQGPHWQISVQDMGIGIAPEFRDRVFTMFARQHPRDQYPGTGIGLSICRKIVENYGGQIDFESEVGKGTTFFFTLPAID